MAGAKEVCRRLDSQLLTSVPQLTAAPWRGFLLRVADRITRWSNVATALGTKGNTTIGNPIQVRPSPWATTVLAFPLEVSRTLASKVNRSVARAGTRVRLRAHRTLSAVFASPSS